MGRSKDNARLSRFSQSSSVSRSVASVGSLSGFRKATTTRNQDVRATTANNFPDEGKADAKRCHLSSDDEDVTPQDAAAAVSAPLLKSADPFKTTRFLPCKEGDDMPNSDLQCIPQEKQDPGSGKTFGLACMLESRIAGLGNLCLIGLNCALLGLDTHLRALNIGEDLPWTIVYADRFLCVLFILELGVKLCLNGASFFSMPGWQENLVDVFALAAQICDVTFKLISSGGVDSSYLCLRLAQLLRLFRLMRYLGMVDELRVLTRCIFGSLQGFGWNLILIILMIYAIGIMFTLVVLDQRLRVKDLSSLGDGELGISLEVSLAVSSRFMKVSSEAWNGATRWTL